MLLLVFELLAMSQWISDPGDWELFGMQVLLVLLLVAPAMDQYVGVPQQEPADGYLEQTRIVFALLGTSLVAWGVIEAVGGGLSAIPIFTYVALLVLMQIGTEVPNMRRS